MWSHTQYKRETSTDILQGTRYFVADQDVVDLILCLRNKKRKMSDDFVKAKVNWAKLETFYTGTTDSTTFDGLGNSVRCSKENK